MKKNPKRVAQPRLASCLNRRQFAVRLYARGYDVRAERSLRSCFQLLGIPEEDQERLEAMGFGRLFGPGSPTEEIADYIESEVSKKRAGGGA